MLISAAEARAQVRGEPEDDVQLELFARAAEAAAMRFLNRNVYETADALAAARTAAAAAAVTAQEELDAAEAAAEFLDGDVEREVALRQARRKYDEAQTAITESELGVVITPDIKIGMLLILGHMFRHRETAAPEAVKMIEMGAQSFLWPYRVGLGV